MKRDGMAPTSRREGRNPVHRCYTAEPTNRLERGGIGARLHEVLGGYRADADRVYLTGSSMGGYRTWALAAAHPERFAAIAPICGGGDPAWAPRLRNVPIWAFHGTDDHVLPAEESQKMVTALEQSEGDGTSTIGPGVGQDAWTRTYADPRLYDWLLAHRRRPVSHGSSGSARRVLRAKAFHARVRQEQQVVDPASR